MKTLQYSLLTITLMTTAACTTVSTNVPADAGAVDGLKKAYMVSCTRRGQEPGKSAPFQELGLSVTEYCSCVGEDFFGAFTQSDLDAFVRDSRRYGKDIGKQAPWDSRISVSATRCLSGADSPPSPGELETKSPAGHG